jgi:hypothetical protein
MRIFSADPDDEIALAKIGATPSASALNNVAIATPIG